MIDSSKMPLRETCGRKCFNSNLFTASFNHNTGTEGKKAFALRPRACNTERQTPTFDSRDRVVFRFAKRIVVTAAERAWVQKLAPYRSADDRQAIIEIIYTLVPFIGVWVLMFLSISISYVLTLLIAPIAACLMVRLFIVQHDCGHRAMFSSRTVNDWVGRTMGIITMTPYEYWRHAHSMHHAGSGNLDKRGFGDIETLTIAEYNKLSPLNRFRYRLYRNPLILFVIGPAYLFILRHRLPVSCMKQIGRKQWLSVLGTNVSIAVLFAAISYFIGWKALLMVQLPIIAMGASIGVWLFYVQHQFDTTHWDHNDHWEHEHAALHGSSFYDLPKPLMWLTGYIGIHHVHHLSSRIPFHKLPKVMEDFPELKGIGRLTFWESLKCIPLTLWDEKSRRMVSFKQASAAAT
jgi:omega-6 fatty acid desaturase (delta-12 desaturase)